MVIGIKAIENRTFKCHHLEPHLLVTIGAEEGLEAGGWRHACKVEEEERIGGKEGGLAVA